MLVFGISVVLHAYTSDLHSVWLLHVPLAYRFCIVCWKTCRISYMADNLQ